jgi:hypothetical protein
MTQGHSCIGQKSSEFGSPNQEALTFRFFAFRPDHRTLLRQGKRETTRENGQCVAMSLPRHTDARVGVALSRRLDHSCCC